MSERARKWSEQSERSERRERTNVARDRVARLKRDGLWLETPSKCASRSAAFIQNYITEADLCLLFTHAPIILSEIRLFRLSPDFLLLPAWTNDQKPEWGTYASTEEEKITSLVTTAVKSITSFCKVRLSVICTWITSGFCVALTLIQRHLLLFCGDNVDFKQFLFLSCLVMPPNHLSHPELVMAQSTSLTVWDHDFWTL